jgi:hypothetical protein
MKKNVETTTYRKEITDRTEEMQKKEGKSRIKENI